MKNILKYSIICAAVLVALTACKNGGGNPADDHDGSLWHSSVVYPASVEVYAGKTLVMSDEYTVDQTGLLASMVRTDHSLNKQLLNLTYSYSGKENVVIAGTFYGAGKKSITASCKDGVVTYQSDGNMPLLVRTTFDTETSLAQNTEFQNTGEDTHYSAQTTYSETYVDNGGDIEKVEIATVSDGQGKDVNPTYVSTSSSVDYEYTYSDDLDLNNFNAYLMPCNFPVWYAKSLPGSKHLITGMKVSHDGREYGVSFTVEYDLDSDGNVLTAVRTDYCGTTVALERTYTLIY
ncbi:MAG: hypothetical protein MJY62_02510 [Bacteroidales bacterium]|nr:hypothetical protein [Bacteroidales bacterium]